MWLSSKKPEEYIIPDDADEVKYYYEDMISYIRLSKDYTYEEKEENKQLARESAQRQVQRDIKESKFKNLENEFHRLRCEFAADYKGEKAHAYDLTEYLINYLLTGDSYHHFESKKYCELLCIMGTYKKDLDYDVVCKSEAYQRVLIRQPQRLLLCFIVAHMEKELRCTWDWNFRFYPNEKREVYLKVLKRCGYVMAEEEIKFYNGTHELYEKEGEKIE